MSSSSMACLPLGRSFNRILQATISAILFLLCASFALAQQTPVPTRITEAIDPANLVTLKGNVHPLAQAQFDRGPAPSSLPLNRMLLVLKRSPDQETALESLLDQQQDKSSPNFHKWLTPQQFGQQFGPSDQDIQTITSWLQSQGFQVTGISHGRTVIEFSGSAGQLQNAFHTEIHNYVVNGQSHWANSTDPQIPAALAPVVAGFASLNNFPPKPMIHLDGAFSRSKSTGKITPLSGLLTISNGGCGVSGNCYGLGPYDFATIYNVNPLWNASTAVDGTGETIAIVGETDINTQDVADFRSFFGMPAPNLNVIHDGPAPGILTDGEESEADLDVEWSSAVAKGATIDFVVSEATETTLGIDLSAQYIVDNDVAPIMSESYGICELGIGSAGNQFFNNLWQQASAEGITVFVSAGDNGSAGCDNFNAPPPSPAQYGLEVSGFASTPYNVAVGGTDFNDAMNPSLYWNASNTPTTQQSVISYIPEEAWNNTCTNPIFLSLGFSSNAETNCNDSRLVNFVSTIGGSGGKSGCTTPSSNTPSSCSGGYSKPSWQTGSGVPNDSKRDIPDVSLYAAGAGSPSGAGYIVCEADIAPGSSCNPSNPSTEFLLVGGTSASSPAFAGIMALVDQEMTSPQGNANYIFYKLASKTGYRCTSAANPASTCVFYDVPSGSTNAMACLVNTANCSPSSGHQYGVLPGYSAGSGYDQATGLGSVNVANLVNDWNTVSNLASTTTLTLNNGSAVSITHGSPVPASISVTPTSPMPTGVVGLVATQSGNTTDFGTLTLDPTGKASGSFSTLPGGTSYTVHAHFPGDSNYQASDSAPVTVNVSPEASKTALSIVTFNPTTGQITSTNATSFPYGSSYVLRSDVTNSSGTLCFNSTTKTSTYPCPTGTLALTDNGSALDAGTFPLNSEGYAEDQPIQLSGGAHSLVANYGGDNSYNASSTTAPITVNPAPTTTTITSVPAPPQTVLIGSPFAMYISTQSQSNGAAPGGNYTILDGSTQIQANTVYIDRFPASSSGPASLSAFLQPTISASAGPHTLTAQYVGDSNYASSTSTAVTVDAVYPDTMSVTATPNTVVYGQNTSVTVTATLHTTNPGSNATLKPTGAITFPGTSGTVTVTPGTDSSGNWMVTASITTTPQQSESISVNFAGDSNYESASNQVFVTVTVPDFTVSAGSSPLTITAGQTGTTMVTITPTTSYTSTVSLACSMNSPGSTCSFSPSSVTLGNSTAATSTLSISTTAPSSTSSAFLFPIRLNKKPDAPIGPVGWWSLSAFLISAALAMLFLPDRRRLLRLSFGLAILGLMSFAIGCGGGGGSVQSNPTPTTTTISTTGTKVAQNTSVPLTASVKGSGSTTPTGSVLFSSPGCIATASTSLVNGTAQTQVLDNIVGTCGFTAQYSGDTNNLTSQSGALEIAVTGATAVSVTGQTGTDTHITQVNVTLQ